MRTANPSTRFPSRLMSPVSLAKRTPARRAGPRVSVSSLAPRLAQAGATAARPGVAANAWTPRARALGPGPDVRPAMRPHLLLPVVALLPPRPLPSIRGATQIIGLQGHR